MHSCSINGKCFDWLLVSRRSCFRAGVRYYVRGKINFLTLDGIRFFLNMLRPLRTIAVQWIE